MSDTMPKNPDAPKDAPKSGEQGAGSPNTVGSGQPSTLSGSISSAASAAKEAAESVANATREKVGEGLDAAGKALPPDNVKETVKATYETAKDKVGDGIESAQKAVTADALKEKGGQALDTMRGAYESAKETISSGFETAKVAVKTAFSSDQSSSEDVQNNAIVDGGETAKKVQQASSDPAAETELKKIKEGPDVPPERKSKL
ncbi:hypothetical protein DFJ74DRAFT_655415 [Hyaloraphidium curvatum]|nr:hypothetical protein DFJ74DRAFT_655415 [Hyaloraphidium curvatum]